MLVNQPGWYGSYSFLSRIQTNSPLLFSQSLRVVMMLPSQGLTIMNQIA